MTEKPFKIKKRLKKNANGNKLAVADDLICIPRPLYLQMIALLKGAQTNAGRATSLLAELPEANKI